MVRVVLSEMAATAVNRMSSNDKFISVHSQDQILQQCERHLDR
jgi:hypothetical protein